MKVLGIMRYRPSAGVYFCLSTLSDVHLMIELSINSLLLEPRIRLCLRQEKYVEILEILVDKFEVLPK